jgi:hypothetical protein
MTNQIITLRRAVTDQITDNKLFFNSGYDCPKGERDYEDAGDRIARSVRRPLVVGVKPTVAQIQAAQANERVIVARMVAELAIAKRWPESSIVSNRILMGNIRRDASREARGIK